LKTASRGSGGVESHLGGGVGGSAGVESHLGGGVGGKGGLPAGEPGTKGYQGIQQQQTTSFEYFWVKI